MLGFAMREFPWVAKKRICLPRQGIIVTDYNFLSGINAKLKAHLFIINHIY